MFMIFNECKPDFQKLIFCHNTDKRTTLSKQKISNFELQYLENGKAEKVNHGANAF